METAVVITIVVVVAIVVVLALVLWASRNSLRTIRTRVDEAWSDLAGLLRRRADLVPGIVDLVGSVATHDAAALTAATDARAESLAASTPAEAGTAESHLQQALRGVFGVAEAYPQLVASQDFLQRQGELVDAEDGIQASRRFYNGAVREFNSRIRTFPGTLVARGSGFEPREYFEAADGTSVAQPPRVQF